MSARAESAKKLAADLRKSAGDLDEIEIFNNQVLVAVYVREEKTSGGIILPDQTRNEDVYQGKVGLILKTGNTAFQDSEQVWFSGVSIKPGDWVFFRGSDSWMLKLRGSNGVVCRVVEDVHVRGKIVHPDVVY